MIKKYVMIVELVEGGNGIKNIVVGVFFLILKDGLEVIWNYFLCFCGLLIECYGG